ncbi:susA, partial [Symbiodinium sp. CCMP2456]
MSVALLHVFAILSWAAAYHPDDHSCSWGSQQVLWQRLRHEADDVLAGGLPWPQRPSWALELGSEESYLSCPFGVHVLGLMQYDALGPEAAQKLDYDRALTFGIGLYNMVTLLKFLLTGWPSFGFIHRLCLKHFKMAKEQSCSLAAPGFRPAEVVASARKQLEETWANQSLKVGPAEALYTLERQLEVVKAMWLQLWQFVDRSTALSWWFGLDLERPCCRMWEELAWTQGVLRSKFELPCRSAHRRLDGAVCPACRLMAQAFWFEDRKVADGAWQAALDLQPKFEDPVPECLEYSEEPGSFAIATVLTSEDLFRSIHHPLEKPGHSSDGDEEEDADATAIVLVYVDALRTLAHSIRSSSRRAPCEAPERPFLVVLSLRAGESLPREALRPNGAACQPHVWHERYKATRAEGIFYSILVDRFANGDISNDQSNIPDFQRDELKKGEPWSLARWRHGGDFHGIQARLGYLRDLGITTLALSPIFLNSAGDYHGKCTTDITTIDSNFGNTELLRELVHDAHMLGIKVVLDVQVNHVCGRGLKYLGSTGSVDGVNLCVASSESTYWSSERGEPLVESVRQRLGWGDSLPAFLRHQSFFVRCGSSLLYRPGGRDFTSLPMDLNATEVEGGLLFTEIFQDDYFELNTMNPVLQELYTNLLKYWIAELDIDGYRITAASHITADFSAYLSTHLRFYAHALGKENFFVVGEVNQATTPHGGNYIGRVQGGAGPATLPQKVQGTLEELCQYYSALPTQEPGFLSTYPLQEIYQLRDTCLGNGWNAMDLYQQPGAARAVKTARGVLEAQGNMRLSMAGVESQSFRKLLSYGQGDELWRLLVATGWSFTWYGIPDIANGVEQGLNGLCYRDQAGRSSLSQKMIDSGMERSVVDSILSSCDYQ